MRWIVVIACIISFQSLGQYSPLQSQYLFNSIALNPASTGSEDAMSIVGTYRAQWVGFPGAPTTQALTVHAPLKGMNSAVGMQVVADQVGVDKRTSINGLYSYRFRFTNSNLRLGISGGVNLVQSNYADLEVFTQGDEQLSSNSPIGVLPNFGVGAYYRAQKHFLSFSIPALLGHRFENNRFRSYNDLKNYNFLLGGGYEFSLKNDMVFKPSTLLKYRINNRPQLDINAQLQLNPIFEIGLSYRTEEAIIGLFEAKINQQFYVMYSFGMPTSKLAKYTFGSHELSLKYNFLYKSNTQSPRFSGW